MHPFKNKKNKITLSKIKSMNWKDTVFFVQPNQEWVKNLSQLIDDRVKNI